MTRLLSEVESPIQRVSQFHISVAVPYIDSLFTDMKSRFSNMAVKLPVSFSIFKPALLPSEEEERLSQYGKKKLKPLLNLWK